MAAEKRSSYQLRLIRRSAGATVEQLEFRRLLSGVPLAMPIYEAIEALGSTSPPSSAYTPSQIRTGYGFNQINIPGITGDGAGQTIAVIDAYNNSKFVSTGDPSFALSDLHKFDLQFGLSDPPSFIKVNQTGGTSYPAVNAGWAGEIALDVEWVHALAPQANIVLVEANSNSYTDLIQGALDYARHRPEVSVITMSFGSNEFATETDFDPYFTTPANHQGITFIASTGDTGSPGQYPAHSPNVLAAGGTSLNLNKSAGGTYISETGWSGSGGGISVYEPKPSYQSGVTQSATKRTIPDISFVADPNTGVAVYDSLNGTKGGSVKPWFQYGGTSLSAPCLAAEIAIVNSALVANGQPTFDGRTQTLPRIYQLPSADFHDVTSGSNGGFSAIPGYDLVTGRGSPIINSFISDMTGISPAILQPPTEPDLTDASDSGTSDADNITNIIAPTFIGSAPAGSSIILYVGDTQIGSSTTDPDGEYTVSSSTMPDGTYNFRVTATSFTTTNSSATLSVTIDTVEPTVTPATFEYDSTQSVSYEFNEPMDGHPGSADISVVNVAGPTPVATASSYDGVNRIVTYTFPDGILADGNYQATLSAAGIHDIAGNVLSGDQIDSFFIMAGDANHDRVVNSLDFNALASNYGANPGTFVEGDFNYDGTVNSADFSLLAERFGTTLLNPDPPPPGELSASSQPTPSLFSSEPISDSELSSLIA